MSPTLKIAEEMFIVNFLLRPSLILVAKKRYSLSGGEEVMMIHFARDSTRSSTFSISARMPYIALCFLALCATCAAYETEYFDWKGLQLCTSKNYTDAIVYFDQAISQDPYYVDGWVHKADAQRALKDFNASLRNYSHALDIDRNKTTALFGMVEAYTALTDYANASLTAARLTELGPTNKVNWLREGNLLQMQGHYSESMAKYEKALELDGRYKDALYRAGISFLEEGDRENALNALDRINKLAPDHFLAKQLQGRIYPEVKE